MNKEMADIRDLKARVTALESTLIAHMETSVQKSEALLILAQRVLEQSDRIAALEGRVSQGL